MTFYIDIQHAVSNAAAFDDQTLHNWACLVLKTSGKDSAELTIRLVGVEEITELNTTYRHQAKSTNVLAFPSELPKELILDYPFLGDVIICPRVLEQESQTLNKSLESHWALILIHGILHLLGYDHIKDDDARIMQSIEIDLLQQLGFENPYLEDTDLE